MNKRKDKSRRQSTKTTTPKEAYLRATLTKAEDVPLDKIDIDSMLQPRVGLSEDKVQEYLVMAQENSEPPPVEIYQDHDGNLMMSDGFHRFRVAEMMGWKTIKAYILPGDWLEARLNAERKNLSHGLGFSRDDKFKILCDRIEYGYGGFIKENDQIIERPSYRDLAAEFGVDPKTIGNWINKIIEEFTVEFSTVEVESIKTAASRGADGRVQDTRNIGKSQGKKTSQKKKEAKSSPKPVQMNIFDWLQSIDDELRQEELEVSNQQMESLNPKGKPINEVDRAYMNGYVDAIQKLRQMMKERKIELK